MTIYPYILDARPAGLRLADERLSLLLMPVGAGVLLQWLYARLLGLTGAPPTIVPNFAPGDAYRSALAESGVPLRAIQPQPCRMIFDTLEPSDQLLIIDPRCIALDDQSLADLRRDLARHQAARFQIALDRAHQGTREYLQFDGEGRLRRIQRYYEGHTWLQTQAVSAALIPASSLWDVPEGSLTDLPRLRHAVAETGALVRDVPIEVATARTDTDAGLLAFVEYASRALAENAPAGYRTEGADIWIGRGVNIAPTARLYGPLVVQDGAEIGADAVVIGPTIVGAGAVISPDTTVIKSVVAPRAHVAVDAVAHQRVVIGRFADGSSAGAPLEDAPEPEFLFDRSSQPVSAAQQVRESQRQQYMRAKALAEGVIAALALLVLSPLFLVLAALVKLTSRGPVFFGHDREGLNGRSFKCWKFRTMVVNAQQLERELAKQANEVDGPQFKLARDPRVTPIGWFLRMSNLDELPQLYNVLRGEMSLIGPRPSPFRENQICIPWRRARLSVRPGISGLWQICRHDRESGDFHQWIYYDIQYARHMSFWLDLKILIATVLTLGGKRSMPVAWLLSREQLRGVAGAAGLDPVESRRAAPPALTGVSATTKVAIP